MKIKNIISILLCLVMLSSCGEGEKGKEGKESRNRSMESGIREKRDSSNANVSDSALKKNSTPLHKEMEREVNSGYREKANPDLLHNILPQ